MFKKVFAVVVVVVAVLALVACGGGDGLQGRWVHQRDGSILEFSGRNYTFTSEDGVVWERGTFSVTGALIEFVHDDGEIDVARFELTENTLWIEFEGTFHRQR